MADEVKDLPPPPAPVNEAFLDDDEALPEADEPKAITQQAGPMSETATAQSNTTKQLEGAE